jgi:hypothetical protein
MQGDPCDGLIYTVKNQVATLVLCSLPNGGQAKKVQQQTRRDSLKSPGDKSGHPSADASEVGDGIMQEDLEAGSARWQAISKALGQHCFRLPGTCLCLKKTGNLHD